MNWKSSLRLFSQSLTCGSGRSWETHPSLISVDISPWYCQGWSQEDVVSRAGDHVRHVIPPSHHMSRVSGQETHCQEVDKVWWWLLQPISLTKMNERGKILSWRENEDLTLERSQKLGKRKHQSSSPHSQAGQAGQWGQRRPRHLSPQWSIVLVTPGGLAEAECPDPDPCTPTEPRPRHNTHSHPVGLTEVKS